MTWQGPTKAPRAHENVFKMAVPAGRAIKLQFDFAFASVVKLALGQLSRQLH